MYKEGFKYHFDQEDNRKINEKNKHYEVQSIEEELLLRRYKPIGIDKPAASKYTATQILQNLVGDKAMSNQYSLSRLGKALSKHGFENTMIRGSKYWRVKLVEPFPERSALFSSNNNVKKGEGLEDE